jgi:hypothetical protein
VKVPIISGVLLSMALAGQATTLFSVSGDPANSFVPDQFSNITLIPPTVTGIATLFDGSQGFDGGLTLGPGGVFYAISNDSLGNSSWWQIQGNGSTTLVGSLGALGQGFLGGLAYNTNTSLFYAAVLDNLGNTTLYSVTAGGVATSLGKSLGTGYSGLAYDNANNLFYGIANDNTGASTLVSFSLAGSVNTIGGLGFGFGGLTYDPSLNAFWVISPVNNVSSQLFQISPTGVESGATMTLGDGYVELATGPVPEPASVGLTGAGLAALAWVSISVNRRKTTGGNNE